MPTQHALSSFWLPQHERAGLITLMTSGQDVGSVAASLTSPRLIRVSVFAVFVFWGILALFWCLVYLRLGASAPEVHESCVNSGEADWIQRNRSSPHLDQARLRHESMLPMRLLHEP